MKKTAIALLALSALLSCSKKDSTTTPTTTTPTKTRDYHNLKYLENDTLYIRDGFTAPPTDSLYLSVENGNDYLTYHGTKYQLKSYVSSFDTYSDSADVFFYDLVKTDGTVIKDTNNSPQIYVAQMYDKYDKRFEKRQQSVQLPSVSPFPSNTLFFGRIP